MRKVYQDLHVSSLLRVHAFKLVQLILVLFHVSLEFGECITQSILLSLGGLRSLLGLIQSQLRLCVLSLQQSEFFTSELLSFNLGTLCVCA